MRHRPLPDAHHGNYRATKASVFDLAVMACYQPPSPLYFSIASGLCYFPCQWLHQLSSTLSNLHLNFRPLPRGGSGHGVGILEC